MYISIEKNEGAPVAMLDEEISKEIRTAVEYNIEPYHKASDKAFEMDRLANQYWHKTYALGINNPAKLDILISIYKKKLNEELLRERALLALRLNIADSGIKLLWRRYPELRVNDSDDGIYLICRCCVVPANFNV